MPGRHRSGGLLLAAVLVSGAAAGCSDDDGTTSAEAVGSPSVSQATDQATDQGTDQGTQDSTTVQDALPEYTSSVHPIGPEVRDRMRTSHQTGCPVALEDLRYLQVRYLGFDEQAHLGELVVHRKHADALAGVFEKLYAARFPVERMQLVDDYNGDDDASMAADNTSAYNCRNVAGTDRWSNHAFGTAVDINPVQNPYVQGDRVDPPAGRDYAHLDRSPGARAPRGVIVADDVVVRAFADIGWEWGGDWHSSKDYQHFSAQGG